MPKFDITIGAKVPAYAKLTVEAKDEAEAWQTATRIARQGWEAPEKPQLWFDPEWDALDEFGAYDVQPADEPTPAATG